LSQEKENYKFSSLCFCFVALNFCGDQCSENFMHWGRQLVLSSLMPNRGCDGYFFKFSHKIPFSSRISQHGKIKNYKFDLHLDNVNSIETLALLSITVPLWVENYMKFLGAFFVLLNRKKDNFLPYFFGIFTE
jgi:hypothetical protein